MYLWFSHPADGSDDRIDTFHNKLSVVLNDGEPFSCQLGIFTDPQYIEDKNVYILLFTMGDGSVEGYKHKYFELFPNK